ncbi:MAG: (d)CMP kinase [Ruminococcaceae bacterium]|nr:(d)CMP kinase [Oscillospiraceae bacterium]
MYKIALDGPSGSGKSVMAKAVAKKLNILYVDTGALYRAIGLFMYRNGVDVADKAAVVANLKNVDVKLSQSEEGQVVYLNGENVNKDIRLPEISMYASGVSSIPEVRAFLLELQRDAAKTNNVIMDGRDIGTVIFPDAEVKIFLFARDEVRAKRRYLELKEKGIDTTLEEVLNDMQRRDENDRTRAIAPAVPAEDAVMLDSSELNIDQTIDAIIDIIEKRIK